MTLPAPEPGPPRLLTTVEVARAPGSTDPLWGAVQVAAHLGVSDSTVRRLAREGHLPHQLVDRGAGRPSAIRFSDADVAAMAQGRPAAVIANVKGWRAVYAGQRSPGADLWVRSRPGKPAPGGDAAPVLLYELADAAAARRKARRRLADARARHGPRSPKLARPRRAHQAATELWVTRIQAAADAGHPIRSVAAMAGVTVPSVLNRLRQPAPAPSDHQPHTSCIAGDTRLAATSPCTLPVDIDEQG